ncbi:hypothetical protein SLH49_10810 [Cognatiyoonia sp. IB215446]|uniref:hypothetical protein n=1 Tax=Cognatiyoonia sp. IB215446 TaxID=3097355 RepID=UPI002A0C1145|nr:hypothetical protein [Cognatiyoonia sp. IB215446]MDX8348477.1 hypothetical protein [Cognatiyoonia sp. IB215446]
MMKISQIRSRKNSAFFIAVNRWVRRYAVILFHAADPTCIMVEDSPDGAMRHMGDLWEIVSLTRCKGPPLRFRGRRIAHHQREVTSETAIFVDVWARRKGDYVVAHSNLRSNAAPSDAYVMTEIDDVYEYLESRCRESYKLSELTDAASAVAGMLRNLAIRQQFAILVGEFLDAFETYHARNGMVRNVQHEV